MQILLVGFVFFGCCCYGQQMADTDDNASHHEKLLLDLFKDVTNGGYNRHIRPVRHQDDQLVIYFQMLLRQLLDVDEKNQVMNTNVWLKHKWNDFKLTWNPVEYGNITSLKIPSEWIWRPDIVLMRNSDGNYTIKHMVRAAVDYQGNVSWQPPAIFKSFCKIDVTYFPFDIQNCSMKFASWTYDELQVKLLPIQKEVDISQMLPNGEWEIVDVHVEHNYAHENNGSEVAKPKSVEVMFSEHGVSYEFIIRRLPLFYTVFLITPCLGISFLTGLVFYLPTESQEKITLCISVLLAHTFYLLVITEIIPSTSGAIPLIGEYLLFTMIFITTSIMITSVVINVHYRSDATHRPLPNCLRYFLLSAAPKFLWLRKFSGVIQLDLPMITLTASTLHSRIEECSSHKLHTKCAKKMDPKLLSAIQGIKFLLERIEREIQRKREVDEWKYVAMVMDRIFLIIFMAISVTGTIVLFLPAWNNYTKHDIENIY